MCIFNFNGFFPLEKIGLKCTDVRSKYFQLAFAHDCICTQTRYLCARVRIINIYEEVSSHLAVARLDPRVSPPPKANRHLYKLRATFCVLLLLLLFLYPVIIITRTLPRHRDCKRMRRRTTKGFAFSNNRRILLYRLRGNIYLHKHLV